MSDDHNKELCPPIALLLAEAVKNMTITSNSEDDIIFEQPKVKRVSKDIYNLQKTKEKLDNLVIGQEEAKRKLLFAAHVAFMNYYNTVVWAGDEENHPPLNKITTLLIGNTGCGKTWLVKCLSECLNVPFVTIDCGTYCTKGWHGHDEIWPKISNSLKQQSLDIYNRGYGLSPEGLLARSIIFLDEFDKISLNGQSDNHYSSMLGKQTDFLNIIEGTELAKGIHTGTMMIVLAGAFQLGQHFKAKDSIGFMRTQEENDKKQLIDDCGFIPELVGRIHSVVTLNKLTLQLLENIATQGTRSLKSQYEYLLDRRITKPEICAIVNLAYKNDKGARSLINQFIKQFSEELLDNQLKL